MIVLRVTTEEMTRTDLASASRKSAAARYWPLPQDLFDVETCRQMLLRTLTSYVKLDWRAARFRSQDSVRTDYEHLHRQLCSRSWHERQVHLPAALDPHSAQPFFQMFLAVPRPHPQAVADAAPGSREQDLQPMPTSL